MSHLRSRPLSRRSFLVGGAAAAGAVALGACGDDDGDADGTVDGHDHPTTVPMSGEGLAMVQFFGGAMFAAGREARLPFGLADEDGILKVVDTPRSLQVRILGPDRALVGDTVEVERRAEGLERAYFPLRATFPEPGIYTARTETGGTATEMEFQIFAAKDVPVIAAGDTMPRVATPTPTKANGVTPYCSREPVCPLHEPTLADALDEARPVALLVSTPAFCKIEICGPVLEVLLDARRDFPGVTFLHAEVYADPEKDFDQVAPIMEELGLTFEPCLVLTGSDGTVVERLDTIFDRTELVERLEALT